MRPNVGPSQRGPVMHDTSRRRLKTQLCALRLKYKSPCTKQLVGFSSPDNAVLEENYFVYSCIWLKARSETLEIGVTASPHYD